MSVELQSVFLTFHVNFLNIQKYHMDPATIGLIVGLATLFIERLYSYAIQIRKSSCTKGTFEVELASTVPITK